MDTSWYDRIADPTFLDALALRPMDELRSMRSACGDIEAQLSYARRLVQGRLDIVEAERVRRGKGLPPSNLAELVAALPAMMAGRLQSNGAAYRARDIGDNEDPSLEIRLDQILDGGSLIALPQSSDDELDAVAQRLVAFERQVSHQRRQALEAFDALSTEVIRRFRDGEVSVDSVLQ
jgi:hypothetical protein